MIFVTNLTPFDVVRSVEEIFPFPVYNAFERCGRRRCTLIRQKGKTFFRMIILTGWPSMSRHSQILALLCNKTGVCVLFLGCWYYAPWGEPLVPHRPAVLAGGLLTEVSLS